MLAIGGGLLAIIALVLANGFFVAAEFALVTVRRTRVERMLAEGRPGARNLDDAVKHLDSYIAACQLGITLASLGLGWVGEPALAHLFDPIVGSIGGHATAIAISFAIITALHVGAGELAPKGIALQYPEQVAVIISAPLRLFRAVFAPVIWLLNEGGWLLTRAVGVRRDVSEHPHIGAEELRLVVQASAQAGAIESEEQFLLERVLRFGDLTVANIMIPRTEVVALPVSTSTEEAIRTVREHHYSRYPVYRRNIDDVIGVLHVRDLLLAAPSHSLTSLLRDPLVVPSHIGVEGLLAEMRARRSHLAVAVDEFGGTDGIVTLEDLLEAIVGELQDEFEVPDVPAQSARGGPIQIDGFDSIDVIEELLGVIPDEGPYNTVAGYILERLGRIPAVGDSVDLGDYRLTVTAMDDLRIAAVEAQSLLDQSTAGEGKTEQGVGH